MAVAIPLGLSSAIYLSEYAQPKVAAVLRPAVELLGGIPTVVYGYFALLFVTPVVAVYFPSRNIQCPQCRVNDGHNDYPYRRFHQLRCH